MTLTDEYTALTVHQGLSHAQAIKDISKRMSLSKSEVSKRLEEEKKVIEMRGQMKKDNDNEEEEEEGEEGKQQGVVGQAAKEAGTKSDK